MASYPISTLAALTNAQLIGPSEPIIEQLLIDSRLQRPHKAALFVALKGERNDGHTYIDALYEKGVRAFIVEHVSEPKADASYLVVENSLGALQAIGKAHRQQFDGRVVAITGSNGKTIVKEWLHQLLKDEQLIVRSPGSWNSQIGVPLSLWNIGEHELGLFEAGVSEAGEMGRLAAMIAPNIGIFTNVGPAHAEGFSSNEAKALEKSTLFASCEQLVFCKDHVEVLHAVREQGIEVERWLDWSREEDAFLQILSEEFEQNKCRLTYQIAGRAHELEVPFTDKASIDNVMHCVTLALHLGVPPAELKKKVAQIRSLEMRLQVLEGVHGSTLVNDAYSNDLASLRIALDHLQSVAGSRKKHIILGDIQESGLSDGDRYEQIGELLKSAGIVRTYLIGSTPEQLPLVPHGKLFQNTNELLAELEPAELANSAVLIKGARHFRLERVVKLLQAKNHATVMEVDLAAIKHNLNTYRRKLQADTKLMVMLKAFGYGGGAPELARLLEFEHVDYFGVAYANEGVQLRREGVNTPIMVMNAADVTWDTFERYGLQPTIHDLAQLQSFVHHFSGKGNRPKIHIELDTGMHRLGFGKDDIHGLIELLKQHQELPIASLFSHLAASDDEAHDDFTREQIARFEKWSLQLQEVIPSKPLRHILNSSGITRHNKAQLDMVRLGIGLYGFDRVLSQELKAAISLRSAISQIKEIEAGESVGYDRSYQADGDKRIAIIPLGYADGFRRSLSNGAGHVWIQNQRAAVLGKVCMDMCMVDVSEIDCSTGDEVILFNEAHPIAELAAAMNTIPYEVLTSFSQRIERRYSREA